MCRVVLTPRATLGCGADANVLHAAADCHNPERPCQLAAGSCGPYRRQQCHRHGHRRAKQYLLEVVHMSFGLSSSVSEEQIQDDIYVLQLLLVMTSSFWVSLSWTAGGTTTDLGVLVNGLPRPAAATGYIAGVRTNFAMPDLHSVGALLSA